MSDGLDLTYPEIRAAALRELETKALANEATAEKFKAEAGLFATQARATDLAIEEAEVEARKTRASWEQGHICRIGDSIGSSSVTIALQRLRQFHLEAPGCDIEVNITSPGGSAMHGMALFDAIREYSALGHQITTVVSGVAASMGAILVEAGDWRVMGREAWFLVHELSMSAEGKVGDLEDLTKWAEAMCDRVARIFVNRSGGKITLAKFKIEWRRKDWWMDSEEALKWGFIDEVR